jgi:hypothetical protein
MNGNSRIKQFVDEGSFLTCIRPLVEELLSLADLLPRNQPPGMLISRPYLGRYQNCAARLEEILDYYGAKNNARFLHLRHSVAAAKQFSRIAYALLHIRYTSPAYCLLPVKGNFPEATERTVVQVCDAVYSTAQTYRAAALECGFTLYTFLDTSILNPEVLPGGLLPADRNLREAPDSAAMVVQLASAFLNQSEEEGLLRDFSRVRRNDYREAVPNPVSENRLRIVQNRFHNLQSLYDTYLSDTNLEMVDAALPVLRGHISIIYHLTEIATVLCHFYERHLANATPDAQMEHINAEEVLAILMDYCLSFSFLYLRAAQKLCRSMLQKYSSTGSVELPVPGYRGFHVRPSTLISKIVMHYGARVKLLMEGAEYDAGIPLDLFRVNEKINAIKRKRVAEEVDRLPVLKEMQEIQDKDVALRIIFFALLEEKKIILYEASISFGDLPPIEGETLGEYARRGIARFLALGKIDIMADITVRFEGDTRALEDIRLLAEHGYGEDKFGNDIVLPPTLSYLRK